MICSVFDKGKTLDYLHHGRLSFIIPQQDETSDYEIAKLAKYRLATLMAIINNKRGWKERTRGPVTTRSVGVPRNAEMVRQTDPLHNFYSGDSSAVRFVGNHQKSRGRVRERETERVIRPPYWGILRSQTKQGDRINGPSIFPVYPIQP